MKDELFVRYAALEKQIAALEFEKGLLKVEVADELNKNNLQELKAEYGTFYFTKRKTWEYPEKVQEAEKQVKIMKKEAEESGEAISQENQSLSFRLAKEKI